MLTETHDEGFWLALHRVRQASRLILVALDDDDLDQVQRLSRVCARDMDRIRPAIEARLDRADRTEDDEALAVMLRELSLANDRIVQTLMERRRETAEALGEVRSNRLRILRWRSGSEDEATVVDRER